jgi:hypothetical protein
MKIEEPPALRPPTKVSLIAEERSSLAQQIFPLTLQLRPPMHFLLEEFEETWRQLSELQAVRNLLALSAKNEHIHWRVRRPKETSRNEVIV